MSDRADQVNAAEIPTTSDTADLANPGLYLMVGVSGDVKVTTTDGSTFVLPNLTAGAWHKIPIKRLWTTGTTATRLLIGR